MPVVRAFWVVVGTLFLAVGALGVILPVLPTTIFVLLAAFCYAKGSSELRAWLDNSRVFGPIIAEWEAHGAIAPRYKVIAVGSMAAVFALGIAASLSATVLIAQAVCMALGAAYVLTRPNGPAA